LLFIALSPICLHFPLSLPAEQGSFAALAAGAAQMGGHHGRIARLP